MCLEKSKVPLDVDVYAKTGKSTTCIVKQIKSSNEIYNTLSSSLFKNKLDSMQRA